MSASKPASLLVAYYSMFGHVSSLAARVAAGAASTGVSVKLVQFPETIPSEILKKMNAPPRNDKIPTITADDLLSSDGFVFGFPTRYGSPPAQFKSFWDSTGGLWAKGLLIGKPYSHFFSTGTQGGGQETTAFSSLPNFVHHGMIHVPMGYSTPLMFKMDEVHGGSPWGAGTYSGADGSRQTTKLELEIAEHQGKYFAQVLADLKAGRDFRTQKASKL